jgi:hypothetical protein
MFDATIDFYCDDFDDIFQGTVTVSWWVEVDEEPRTWDDPGCPLELGVTVDFEKAYREVFDDDADEVVRCDLINSTNYPWVEAGPSDEEMEILQVQAEELAYSDYNSGEHNL